MGWPASILVALLTAGAGLLAAGFVMNLCVGWYRISSFEGKSGYAVVVAALLGGLAGLVIGLVTARLVVTGGLAGFGTSLGVAWAVVGGLAGLGAAAARALADLPPTLGGRPLSLEVEVRLPAGAPRPALDDAPAPTFHLHSIVRHVARKSRPGEIRLADVREEEGRWVVPAAVDLFTGRGARGLGFSLAGQAPFGFVVPLPARPSSKHETWSDWGPRPPPPQTWPEDRPSYRFRVRRVGPEEPAP